MAKIKLTKGELKRQRDALKQFLRYLPTLQLKKQQLQLEILQQNVILQDIKQILIRKKQAINLWAGLLAEPQVKIKLFLKPEKIITHLKNIAGVGFVSEKEDDFTADRGDKYEKDDDDAVQALFAELPSAYHEQSADHCRH